MKNVLIVEDKLEEREALAKLVSSVDCEVVVHTASSLGEACECCIKNDISLFLVDIILQPHNINDISGIQFVEMIRNMPRYKFVPVIFITSVEDRTYSAYKKLHCYSYINKPLHYIEAEKVIREALEFKHPIDDDKLILQQNKKLFYINKSDIVYIHSKAGKMVITTVKDKFDLYYFTCEKILNRLKSNKFKKCKRGMIVNLDYIDSVDYESGLINLTDGYGVLKIGVTKRKDFFDDML